MTPVTIDKVRDPVRDELPILDELERMIGLVRERAFDLFARRGFQTGRDLDDWLQAEREVFGFPASELQETETGFQLKVSLPGFAAGQVKVTALAGEWIVQAFCEKQENESSEVHWSEFSTCQVLRRFRLPAPVNLDTVTATLDQGLLTVTGQKTTAVPARGPVEETQETKAPPKAAAAAA